MSSEIVLALPDLADRLLRSLRLSAVAGACGMLGVAIVYVAVLPSGWLLVVLVAAGLHQGALVPIRRACHRGAVARAAVLFCAADWTVVMVALFVVPAFAPALVPIVIARIVSTLPYLDRPALLHLVEASLGVGVVVGVLSRLDLVGVDDRLPDLVVTAFVVFFVPVGIAIVGVDLWQHSATLLETAQRALRANVGLRASQQALAEQAEELHRSRSRLVVAADVERRRIERDLHDGAQQTLVGLCLGVALLADRQPEGSEQRAELDRLEGAAQHAVAELRVLAHGVYPPILATRGLAPALEAVLRRCRLPVRTDVDRVGRRSQEQEAAVYFSCCEALQNTEKHAGPSAGVTVSLSEDSAGVLRFCVADSGRGFDVASAPGHGMLNMRDRLEAVGGTLTVRSSPAAGTSVTGVVPPSHRCGPAPRGVASSARPL